MQAKTDSIVEIWIMCRRRRSSVWTKWMTMTMYALMHENDVVTGKMAYKHFFFADALCCWCWLLWIKINCNRFELMKLRAKLFECVLCRNGGCTHLWQTTWQFSRDIQDRCEHVKAQNTPFRILLRFAPWMKEQFSFINIAETNKAITSTKMTREKKWRTKNCSTSICVQLMLNEEKKWGHAICANFNFRLQWHTHISLCKTGGGAVRW